MTATPKITDHADFKARSSTAMTYEQAPSPEEAAERVANAQAAVEALQRAAKDAIAPTAALTMQVVHGTFPGEIEEAIPEHVRLVASTPGGDMPIAVTEHAHEQIAEKVGIPYDYYWRMLNEQPALLSDNVNVWLRANPARRLLRMLDPMTEADKKRLARTGSVISLRAFLSDTYRPIDHASLLNVVLPEITSRGGWVKEFSLTETRMRLKFLTQEHELAAIIEREGVHQAVARGLAKGETIRQGGRLSNSETGDGSWNVEPFIDVLRCTNGYIGTSAVRGAHVGKRHEADGFIARDTERLENSVIFLKVRDKVIEVLSDETLRKVATAFAEAAGTPLDLPKGTPLVTFVERIGRRFDLTEGEVAVLQEETMLEMAATGRLTPFTIAQGFTASAKRADDAERRGEIEATGWRVLTDPVERLLKAGLTPTDREV